MNVHVFGNSGEALLKLSFLWVSLPCMKVIIMVGRLENYFPFFL